MFRVPAVVGARSVVSGHHDEYLPSVDGGRANGEEVRRKHKKGLFQDKTNPSKKF